MKKDKKKHKRILVEKILSRISLALFMFIMPSLVFAQGKTVTGTVTDAQGEPMIGVSVVETGTSHGVVTDINGRFSLTNVSENAELKFTSVGYVPQKVLVTGKSSIKITMLEDTKVLDELVVVGYGVQKKSDVTGALTQVSSKDIESTPVQNAVQAIQGRAAGVDVTTNNRPGEIGDIRIRGNRSVLAGNDPLYVIDGIPMTAGAISDINPNDIASMEILKDASATAIYGSRGANGVILITTKKASKGKTTISYDGALTTSNLHSLTNYMNAGQQLDYNRKAAIVGGTYQGAYGTAPDPDRDRASWLGTESYMDAIVQAAYKYDSNGNIVLRDATAEEIANGYADKVPIYDSSNIPTTDWGKLVTRTAITQNHQISLSAGYDKSNLYMSLAYLDQQVPMKDQNYKRYTVNINGTITPLNWLTVGFNLNAAHSIKNYGIISNFNNTVAKDSYGLAMTLMPYAPAYDENGDILIASTGLSEHNVLRNINSATNEYRYYGTMFSSYAEIKILPWLKWRTNLGAQYRNSRYGSFYSDTWTNPFGYASTSPDVGYDGQDQNLSWTLENLIYLNQTFNKIHSLGVTLMQSAEKYRTEGINIRAYEIVYPTSMWYDLGDSNKDKVSYGTNYSTWTRASYMARVNYALMDKYLLTMTGRYDGASVLAEGHKWDFFPSAALAWRIDQEKFMTNIKWIYQLKLRLGYGVTGNSSVDPYSTAGSVTSIYANIPFGAGNTSNTVGVKTDAMPNTMLSWEKTASTNFGFDFGILNNRISGSIDYYAAKTSALLMNRSIPIITGYGQVKDNVGKTQNNGIEVSLTTHNIQKKDFKWSTTFSFSTNKEKIVELADGVTKNTTNLWFVGSPINVFYDYQYDRIWQNTDEDKRMMAVYKANSLTFLPGQYKIKDQDFIEVADGTEGSVTKSVTIDGVTQNVTYMDNGFGKFNDDDKIIYQKTPKLTCGLFNSFTYKNFDLSFFAYLRTGNTYYGLTQTIGRRIENDTWSETNTGAKYAQPTTAIRTSTYDYVRNYTKGNMLIIRNIALSYNLPESILTKIKSQSAQIYVQVLNPFIFGGELVQAGINPDDITGWDNTSHIGGQTNNTCITRSFVLGLKFSL